MTCPFAKFASILPIIPTASRDAKASFHAIHGFTPPLSSAKTSTKLALTLSEALRAGTAKSHRAVEKSRGVSLLLQSVSSPSSAQEDALKFDRVDYVRFNIMLACVYIALEASMFNARSTPLLSPLFNDGDLVSSLMRSTYLLEDIQAHLDTIQLHTGAVLAELAEQAREETSIVSASTSSLTPEDIEHPAARTKLLHLVQESLPIALILGSSLTRLTLTSDHLALLGPAQIRSTLAYVEALLDLSREPSGVLLGHAYTRYLGDLSGGQHIMRKVSKRFPAESAEGFSFYRFHEPNLLKTRFRDAMEHGLSASTPSSSEKHANLVERVVAEANTAFDMNTALFESLLPAHLRMAPDQAELHQPAVIRTQTKLVPASSTTHKVVLLVVVVASTIWLGRSWFFPMSSITA